MVRVVGVQRPRMKLPEAEDEANQRFDEENRDEGICSPEPFREDCCELVGIANWRWGPCNGLQTQLRLRTVDLRIFPRIRMNPYGSVKIIL